METGDVIGIDVGGVIIDRANDNTAQSFLGSNFLQAAAVPGAFDAIRRLFMERFGPHVYLVSRCGLSIQEKTSLWLQHHDFYAQTGVAPRNVMYCLERHQKAEICRRLGITYFIDDRLEVLSYLTMVPYRFLFRPRQKEIQPYEHILDRVRVVTEWQQVLDKLLKSSS
jgi:hypothetical protein